MPDKPLSPEERAKLDAEYDVAWRAYREFTDGEYKAANEEYHRRGGPLSAWGYLKPYSERFEELQGVVLDLCERQQIDDKARLRMEQDLLPQSVKALAQAMVAGQERHWRDVSYDAEEVEKRLREMGWIIKAYREQEVA